MVNNDRTYKLFKLFIRAADLEHGPINFASRQKTYLGLRDEQMTEEEVIDSIEFTCFIDGYEGREPRYKKRVEHGSHNPLKKGVISTEEFKKNLEQMALIADKLHNLGGFTDEEKNDADMFQHKGYDAIKKYNNIMSCLHFYDLGKSYFMQPLD